MTPLLLRSPISISDIRSSANDKSVAPPPLLLLPPPPWPLAITYVCCELSSPSTGSTSNALPVIEPVMVRLPTAVGNTVTTPAMILPALTSPTSQVTVVPAMEHIPWSMRAALTTTSAGTLMVATRSRASSGPVFDTANGASKLWFTGSEPVGFVRLMPRETTRSPLVRLMLPELLAG